MANTNVITTYGSAKKIVKYLQSSKGEASNDEQPAQDGIGSSASGCTLLCLGTLALLRLNGGNTATKVANLIGSALARYRMRKEKRNRKHDRAKDGDKMKRSMRRGRTNGAKDGDLAGTLAADEAVGALEVRGAGALGHANAVTADLNTNRAVLIGRALRSRGHRRGRDDGRWGDRLDLCSNGTWDQRNDATSIRASLTRLAI
jgi:hypothetical protein